LIWNRNKDEAAKLILMFEFRLPEHRKDGGGGITLVLGPGIAQSHFSY
jgi:hypothetical protein